MVLIPSSVLKSTGKLCLMKPCLVTLPLPILKSKGKYVMAEKPSRVYRVSLSHVVEIGLIFFARKYHSLIQRSLKNLS
jgi:hypothetical protein